MSRRLGSFPRFWVGASVDLSKSASAESRCFGSAPRWIHQNPTHDGDSDSESEIKSHINRYIRTLVEKQLVGSGRQISNFLRWWHVWFTVIDTASHLLLFASSYPFSFPCLSCTGKLQEECFSRSLTLHNPYPFYLWFGDILIIFYFLFFIFHFLIILFKLDQIRQSCRSRKVKESFNLSPC